MRKLTLALSTAALGLSGAALAQTAQVPARSPKPDMTRAEAQARAEAMFARMDANKDGIFDQADRAAMKTQMFDRMDSDRNGAVSRAEFDAMHGQRGGHAGRMGKSPDAPATADAPKAGRKAEMFARMDADKNGSLSRAEIEAMHAAGGGAMKHGGEGGDHGKMDHGMGAKGPGGGHGMMGAGSGPVTRQAFIERALAKFDRADANRDGIVTQAERKAARETMRQQSPAKREQG